MRQLFPRQQPLVQSIDHQDSQVLAKLKLSSLIELLSYTCTEEGRSVPRRSVA